MSEQDHDHGGQEGHEREEDLEAREDETAEDPTTVRIPGKPVSSELHAGAVDQSASPVLQPRGACERPRGATAGSAAPARRRAQEDSQEAGDLAAAGVGVGTAMQEPRVATEQRRQARPVGARQGQAGSLLRSLSATAGAQLVEALTRLESRIEQGFADLTTRVSRVEGSTQAQARSRGGQAQGSQHSAQQGLAKGKLPARQQQVVGSNKAKAAGAPEGAPAPGGKRQRSAGQDARPKAQAV